MTDPADIADERNWCGGFYELYLQLDTDFAPVVSALARAAGLGAVEVPDGDHWRGVVTSPLGRVVCGMFASTYEDGESWLTFYLPLGALAELDRRVGGYPFGSVETSLDWREPLDTWLAGLAAEVFSSVGFRRGLIGFEIDDTPESAPWEGHLRPVDGRLQYTPATR